MDDRVKSKSNGQFSEKETTRESSFKEVWSEELNDAFADIARYYDSANYVASLGLWGYFRNKFVSIIDLKTGYKALDVCAGTNAIGLAMLEKETEIAVSAIDRSEEMQRVGQQRVQAKGFTIDSTISDVHELPFPDNHFDVVTLQYASRHLRVIEVFSEIQR
ncbi:MAG: class I SAM-dependent methyltransferase, partial [Pseudomonadales bacterium]|nr:class I SAM-dependent methyltransferase [Pseudomonadales bacterium]